MDKLKNLSLRTHYKIHLGLLLSGLLIGFVFSGIHIEHPVMTVGMVIGIVLMLSGLVWKFVFVRCPHCGSGMPRGGLPNFCPCCGKKLL